MDYTGNKLAVFVCSVLPVLGEGREEERGGVVERRSQCGAAAHLTSHSTQQTSRELTSQVKMHHYSSYLLRLRHLWPRKDENVGDTPVGQLPGLCSQ